MSPRAPAWLALVSIACGGRLDLDRERPFTVNVHASSDDGEPLAGVTLDLGTGVIGPTSSSGDGTGVAAGKEGDAAPVATRCPPGFDPTRTPEPLLLTRTRQVGTNRPEPIFYTVTCVRQMRDVVVVVRAEHGASLPVEVDGKPLVETDAEGVAHVLVRVARAVRSITVSLDTHPRDELRPQNPSRTFELDGRDAILIYDRPFTLAPALPRRRGRAKPHIPYRLD